MRILLLCCLFSLLSACASLPKPKLISPKVTVESVRPVSLSLTSQTIGLTLRVANPNSIALPMKSLSFNARFSGEKFAQGQSVEKVTIPAKGDALLEVEVTAGLVRLANQLKAMLDSENAELNYDVTGFVTLSNWPKPIPFNVEGEIEDPRVLSE